MNLHKNVKTMNAILKQKYSQELFIHIKMAYFCCFNSGEIWISSKKVL